MSSYVFPFRRMTKCLRVPVTTNPTQANALTVPPGFINPQYKSFMIVNPNACWVNMRGTSATLNDPNPTQANLASADDDYWLLPPHHFGVYSTQNPLFVSAIALAMPGFTLPAEFVPLRLAYGVGA